VSVGGTRGPRLGEERRQQIREMLMERGAVTIGELQSRFGVSSMTARRDLEALASRGYAQRAHGGAVLPSVVVPENSFAQRVHVASEAKQRLAEAALALLRAGETLFLDSSSTAYNVARQIALAGLEVRVITNSGPVVQLLTASDDPRVELCVIGGMLRRLTSSFVGPSSIRAIKDLFADRAIVSVAGITSAGMLTDADALEAQVKRSMIEQSSESLLLLDETKLATHARQAIVSLSAITVVIADGVDGEDAQRLRAAGPRVQLI
jgi:DeoR/GlpR family transcriptional regulator of sugar metabolism